MREKAGDKVGLLRITHHRSIAVSETIQFNCPKCGSNTFIKPDKLQPDDTITCAGCGTVTRWADFRAQVVEAAKEIAKKAFRDVLGKR